MMSAKALEMAETKTEEFVRDQKFRKTIRADWDRNGYEPRSHLYNVTGEGDATILADWIRKETDQSSRSEGMGHWLASRAMIETMHAIGFVLYSDGRIVNWRDRA
jgi:hypothetical protein